MNYVEANLAHDEKIIARIEHSWKGLISSFVICIFLSAFGIAMITVVCPLVTNFLEDLSEDDSLSGFIIFFQIMIYAFGAFAVLSGIMEPIRNIVDIKCSQLVVTDKRLFGRRGFISKKTTDITLGKVDTVNAENGVLGAIFHYGSIQIVSDAFGTDKATLNYDNISNTTEFQKTVLKAIEKAKAQEREEQTNTMRGKANDEA